MQPDVEDHRYFKLCILLDQIILLWNTIGLHHQVAKIKGSKNLSLCQRLNFFDALFKIYRYLLSALTFCTKKGHKDVNVYNLGNIKYKI